MEIIYTLLMIGLLIAVVFLTGKVLRLQMNFYVMKFQNMESENDSQNKFDEIDSILNLLVEKAKFIEDKPTEPIEHNPLLDYRNDLIKTLTFKKAKIKNKFDFECGFLEFKKGYTFTKDDNFLTVHRYGKDYQKFFVRDAYSVTLWEKLLKVNQPKPKRKYTKKTIKNEN